VLCLDRPDQRRHLLRLAVVDAERAAGAAGGPHQLVRLLDGLRPPELRWPVGLAAAARGVDEHARAGQFDGDRASGPSRGPGDERDPAAARALLTHGRRPSSRSAGR
jgi:hypothetical protein